MKITVLSLSQELSHFNEEHSLRGCDEKYHTENHGVFWKVEVVVEQSDILVKSHVINDDIKFIFVPQMGNEC
jgi:hypothetical protein